MASPSSPTSSMNNTTTKTNNNPNKNKERNNYDCTSPEFLEALDDVHSRFILNLPPAELSSSDRIFFQLEQAFWFYEDFYCDCGPMTDNNNSNETTATSIVLNNNNLPRYKCLYPFAQKMFSFSPLLQPLLPKFNEMWKVFSSYKRGISTYGTILLNTNCTKVILCQDWNGKAWTFPAGKVNENEVGIDAASRETYEETGFDPTCINGLTRTIEEEEKHWSSLREEDALVYTEEGSGKRRTCYVCKGVPEDFPFNPVARKEVSQVSWLDLQDLTTLKTFAVLPFVNQLRRWIRKNTGIKVTALDSVIAQYKNSLKQSNSRANSRGRTTNDKELAAPNSKKSATKKSRTKDNSNNSRPNSTSKKRVNNPDPSDTFLGDTDGWSEKDMFLTNEKILGRKIEYDGNPHHFWNDNSDDPHRFHIVGGSFMNSNNKEIVTSSSPPISPPEQKKKPQNNTSDDNSDDASLLQPFFTHDGKTPWGEVVNELPSSNTTNNKAENNKSAVIDFKNLSAQQVRQKLKSMEAALDTLPQRHNNNKHKQQNIKNKNKNSKKTSTTHWDSLLCWGQSLDRPPSTSATFKFDTHAIIHAMDVAIGSK